MEGSREVPKLVTDLFWMSKDYLRQEVTEPARRLGRFAGIGLAGGAFWAVAALFLGLAANSALHTFLPEGDWWEVAAKGGTALATGAGAAVLGWAMTRK